MREVTDEPQHVSPRQEFSSERELIETVKARREQAQAFRAIADEIEVEMGEETDRYNPDLVDGVLVRWINPGRAARDETAFRHALKTAHRLRAAGERMTDAAIIDAYERAYNIAQREGADGRAAEMPPMRDRQTMARCVRGYVTQGKTDSYGTPTAKYATTSQRKALATMGGRGGKKAAQRWETDPEGEYAQSQRKNCKMPTSESVRRETIPAHKSWRSFHRFSIKQVEFLCGKKSPRSSMCRGAPWPTTSLSLGTVRA